MRGTSSASLALATRFTLFSSHAALPVPSPHLQRMTRRTWVMRHVPEERTTTGIITRDPGKIALSGSRVLTPGLADGNVVFAGPGQGCVQIHPNAGSAVAAPASFDEVARTVVGLARLAMWQTNFQPAAQGAILGQSVQGGINSVAADAPADSLYMPPPATFNEPSAGHLLNELLQRQRAQVSRLGHLSRIMGSITSAGEAGAAADNVDTKQPAVAKADAGAYLIPVSTLCQQ